MKINGIAGDGSSLQSANVWAEQEGALICVTIDPANDVRADAVITPDQADVLAAGLIDAARAARIAAGQPQ